MDFFETSEALIKMYGVDLSRSVESTKAVTLYLSDIDDSYISLSVEAHRYNGKFIVLAICEIQIQGVEYYRGKNQDDEANQFAKFHYWLANKIVRMKSNNKQNIQEATTEAIQKYTSSLV